MRLGLGLGEEASGSDPSGAHSSACCLCPRMRPKVLACQSGRSWVWGVGSAWKVLDSWLARCPSLDFLCPEQLALIWS